MKKILLVLLIFISLFGHSQKVTNVNGVPLLQTKAIDGVDWLNPTYAQQFAQTANDSLVNVENLNCVEALSVQLNKQESFVFFPSAVSVGKLHYEDVNRGLDDFTVVRNSTATRINDKNLIEEVSSDIARIDYSDATFTETEPESLNIAFHSEEFDDVVWIKDNGGSGINPVVTANFADAPDGTATAERVQFDRGVGTGGGDISRLRQTVTSSDDLTASVWLKLNTGTSETLILASGTTSNNIVVTDVWQRFSAINIGTGDSIFIYSAGTVSNQTIDALIWGGQSSPTDELTRYVTTTTAIDGVPPLYDLEGCGVLLTEDQATNLVTYSEDFTQGVWTKVSTSIVADQAISPDGTLNADEWDRATGRIQRSISTANTTTTLYVKSATATSFGISTDGVSGDDHVIYNLTNKTITTLGSNNISASITPIGNGWDKLTATRGATAGTILYFNLSGGDVATYYIWGAQVEASSIASSYIKTLGSTVTRLKDEITNGGTVNDFNSEEGVLFVEMSALSNLGIGREITISNGTGNDRIIISYNTANQIEAAIVVSGVIQAQLKFTTDITISKKIAFKWKINDFALYIDGLEVLTDNSGSVYSANTLNQIHLGNFNGSGGMLFAKTKQIKVYPIALTDEELIELTSLDPITIKAINGIDLPDSDLTYNYVQDISEESYTYENIPAVYEGLNQRGDNASFTMIPSGYTTDFLIPQSPIKDSLEFGDWSSHWFDVNRASVATRVNEQGLIEEMAIDVPRIDFTDGVGVLLTEPQSTNLYLNSDVMVTQNVTTTADDFTVSFYGTGTITFTGTHSGSLVGTGANERVSSTFIPTAGTLTSTVSGTVLNGQIENLDYATSVIITAGSTVTRLKDEITNGGTVNDFNSEEGVLYAEIEYKEGDIGFRVIAISDGTVNSRLFMYFSSGSLVNVRAASTGGTISAISTTINRGQMYKVALSYKDGLLKFYLDGVKTGSDGVYTGNFPGLDRIEFAQGDGGNEFFGKTKQIKVYKSIADAQKDLPYITNFFPLMLLGRRRNKINYKQAA